MMLGESGDARTLPEMVQWHWMVSIINLVVMGIVVRVRLIGYPMIRIIAFKKSAGSVTVM
jgi:hypothetical protein